MENLPQQKSKKPTPKFLIVGFVLIILAFMIWANIRNLSLMTLAFLPVPLIVGGTGVIFILTGCVQLLFHSKSINDSKNGVLQEVKPFNKKVFISIIVFGVVLLGYVAWILYPYIVRK